MPAPGRPTWRRRGRSAWLGRWLGRWLALWLALAAGLSLGVPNAAAQRGATALGTPTLRRMYHRAWVGETGPPLGSGYALARSGDGYLWMGTTDGLLRFDGLRFTLVDSATSPALRSARGGVFWPSVSGRDGTVWISRPDDALVTYRDGVFRVVHRPEPGVGSIVKLDGAGRVWLYGHASRLRLLRPDGTTVPAPLPAGVPDSDITSVVRDTGRGIWIGTHARGLWHVVGNRGERVSPLDVRPRAEVRPLVQSRDGTLWAIGSGIGSGLCRLVGGRWVLTVPTAADDRRNVVAAVEDSAHALWFGTVGDGVWRWRDGTFERFGRDDGLSDVSVDALLSEPGGGMWVATTASGLDLLRPTAFTTVGRRDGVPFDSPYRVAPDASGSLWAVGLGTGRPVELRGGALDGRDDAIQVTPAALPPDDSYEILDGARGGGVWLGPRRGGLLRYRHGHVERWGAREGLPHERLFFALETRDGSVWLGTTPRGLGRLRDGRYAPVALPGAPAGNLASVVEDSSGHVWLSVHDSAYVYELSGDRVVRRLGPRDGLTLPVRDLVVERPGVLWGATDSGLVRIADGRVQPVRVPALATMLRRRPALASAGAALWIVSHGGVARVAFAALHAAAADPRDTVVPRVFTASDGLAAPRRTPFTLRPVERARDGRLWIATPAGLAVTDPAWEQRAPPPPARVEALTSLGQTVRAGAGGAGAVPTIPPNPERVALHFTTINLVAGDRTRVQYRLDGVDQEWVDGTASRVATYTQLRPGRYVFRARGWNEDGVPSPGDATLAFQVLPAWYETLAARGAVVALFGTAVAAAALAVERRRDRRATALLRSQFEATLAERARIAGELHDTLLQGFTGIVLQLEGLRQTLARAPNTSTDHLSRILTLADRTLRDARESVWDLRAPAPQPADDGDPLEAIVEGAAADDTVRLHTTLVGVRGPLAPQVDATVRRIGREAVHNAVRHARAHRIDVVLAFAAREVRLTVRDDGVGMRADPFGRAPATGHFGLVGMRERAARAGGALEITSAPGEGTCVELALPR